MTVDDLYRFLRELIRKNQSTGLSEDEFGDFWNDSQYAYLSDLTGRFNARNNTKEGGNIGLIETELVLTKLAPFTIQGSLAIALGVAPRPTDFHYKMAIRVNGYQCKYVHKNRIARMQNDPIDPPSTDDNAYYYTEYATPTGIQYSFFPSSVTAAELDYIRLPKAIKWGSQPNTIGQLEYDPNDSQDSEWDIPSSLEISKRMLTDIGVSYKDSDFSQFGNTGVITGE